MHAQDRNSITAGNGDDVMDAVFNHFLGLSDEWYIAVLLLTCQPECRQVEHVRLILGLQQDRLRAIPHTAQLALPHTNDVDGAMPNHALVPNLLERWLPTVHAHAEVWRCEVEEPVVFVVCGDVNSVLVDGSTAKQRGRPQHQWPGHTPAVWTASGGCDAM